jgi:hypothetical protein
MRLHQNVSAFLDVVLVLACIAIVAAAVLLAGCGVKPSAPGIRTAQTAKYLTVAVTSAGKHVDAAAESVATAQPVAGEAAAKPLADAAGQLSEAKSDITAALPLIGRIYDAAETNRKALDAESVAHGETKTKLVATTQRVADLEHQWESHWLGGRFYRLLRVVLVFALSLTGLAFLLCFLGLLGPGTLFTWLAHVGRFLFMAVPWVGSAFIWIFDFVWHHWAWDYHQAKAKAAAQPQDASKT